MNYGYCSNCGYCMYCLLNNVDYCDCMYCNCGSCFHSNTCAEMHVRCQRIAPRIAAARGTIN